LPLRCTDDPVRRFFWRGSRVRPHDRAMISRDARRRLFVFAVWPLFGVLFGFEIQISMLAHHHSWARILSYQVLVWSIWIAYTFAIGRLLRAVALRRLVPPARTATHVAAAFGFGALHVLLWVASEFVLKPYDFMNPTRFGPRLAGVMFY